MKRFIVLTLGIIATAGVASAVITGSAHDFTAFGWSSGEICLPCHVPHNGATGYLAPLWNHEQTAATYNYYDSSTMVPAAQADQLIDNTTITHACMSCHDGTVALDSFGGATGSTTITGTANFGTDLTNDHPIAFQYSLSTTDTEIWATPQNAAIQLFNGNLECASCHDPHNTPGNANMLVMSNAGSALCLACHNK